MKIGRKLFSAIIALSISISGVHASGADVLLGGIVGAIIGSNVNSHTTTKHKYRKRSKYPAGCKKERWSAQVINNQPIATNFQGLLVTTTQNGELLVKAEIKNQIPSIFRPGDNVQVNMKFSSGKRTINGTLDDARQNLLIKGVDAIYILDKLKSASYAQVKFANNTYCTRLRGSSNAIKTVETAMLYTKQNHYVVNQSNMSNSVKKNISNTAIQARGMVAPVLAHDSINNARVSRAMSEHLNHATRLASNQKEFAQKVVGIRPQSDLDAADGNIYDIKIQYYIPGSEEIGEMWVDWFIDDDKGPMMRLHFMDPTHKYEKEAYKMQISLEPIKAPCNTDIKVKSNKNTSPACDMVKDLLIADKWAKIAKKQDMKRRYKKRVSYIYGDVNSTKSLGVNFQVYENGAMTVQLEEMKHGFPKRFNFTFKQALELARYIENTREKAHKKWMNKTRSKEDLDALFN